MKNTDVTILLALLPFWPPQIPPLGLACLKGALQAHGYRVQVVDANVEEVFSEIHVQYFELLKELIPSGHQGNIHNVGYNVFAEHLMAHQHRGEERVYLDLLKTIIEKTFYFTVDQENLFRLEAVIATFYLDLEQYLRDLLCKEKPTVFGLTVYQGTLPASLFAFKLAKEINPEIKNVMGGGIFANQLALNSPNLQNFIEQTPYIDQLIIGEGEILFLKYLRGELPKLQKVVTLHEIQDETLNLNQAVVPDLSDYALHHYPYLPTYSSRSCPFECSFCSEMLQWGRYRKKNPVRMSEELLNLARQYDRQLFLLCDSLLNPIITPLSKELLKQEESVYWDGYLRADHDVLNPENVLLWRQAGFYRARLGLESGSPHVLQLMHKKITPEEIKQAVFNLANVGIKTTTYWVIGHPGETEEDFLETLHLLEEMKDDVYEAWCSPFYYYRNGQVEAGEWEEKSILLYPPNAKDWLLLETWILDMEPSRDVIYERMNRFIEHCQKIGIPNPFSLHDFHEADERWKKLHLSAVPALVEFQNKSYIHENKSVTNLLYAQNDLQDEINFGF